MSSYCFSYKRDCSEYLNIYKFRGYASKSNDKLILMEISASFSRRRSYLRRACRKAEYSQISKSNDKLILMKISASFSRRCSFTCIELAEKAEYSQISKSDDKLILMKISASFGRRCSFTCIELAEKSGIFANFKVERQTNFDEDFGFFWSKTWLPTSSLPKRRNIRKFQSRTTN